MLASTMVLTQDTNEITGQTVYVKHFQSAEIIYTSRTKYYTHAI